MVRENGITLITKEESGISSNVTEEEAFKFLQVEVEKNGLANGSAKKPKKDEDDIMDEIE